MMLISAETAESLASVILRSTQGENRVKSQLPWSVEDRGEFWLVKGTPFADREHKLQHCQFTIFFQKTSAEVVGLRSEARIVFDPILHATIKADLPEQKFQGLFGPARRFEPETMQVDFCAALYGGLINTPEDAIDFAYALAQGETAAASFAKSSYEASETSGTWRIVCRGRHGCAPIELCSFLRKTGKIVAGVLLN